MTLPSTRPTKTGYDFNGWKVKTASSGGSSGGLMCGLTNETIGAEIVHTWAKQIFNNETICRYDAENADCSSSPFTSMTTNSLRFQSNYGTYDVIASCNSTMPSEYETLLGEAMSQMQAGTMTEDEVFVYIYGNAAMKRPADTFDSTSTGPYCWCKTTGYTPNVGGQQCSTANSSWLFYFVEDAGTSSNNMNICLEYCYEFVRDQPGFRTALFSN
jgi:hypothetical protein